MKIISLELIGYLRLALTGINYLKIIPESKLQLILGTNGSGKSSLLYELSPLPALSNSFSKGGSKTIILEHNKNYYELSSNFTNGNKYSFLKNSEELNPGYTITVYKDLVKKEFNLTAEVHEVLLGLQTFHSMSVLERRNWFTNLSNLDYNYAISYYMKLKEQLRDIQGAIKLNQSRLVQESDKLLNPNEENDYRLKIVELNKLLAMLLDMKSPMATSREYNTTMVSSTESKIRDVVNQLTTSIKLFTNEENYRSIQDIDNAIINYQASINHYSLLVDTTCKTIESKQKTLDALAKTNLSSINDTDSYIASINSEIALLTKQLKFSTSYIDPKEQLQALTTIYDNLVDIFTHIEVNPMTSFINGSVNREISQLSYTALLETQSSLAKDIFITETEVNKYSMKKKELDHFKAHNRVECPKCTHTWYQGYDDQTYDITLKELQKYTTKLTTITASNVKLQDDLLRYKNYLSLQKSYIDIATNWKILSPLWLHIKTSEKFFTNPKSIVNDLDQYRQDILIAIQIATLDIKLKEVLELKEVVTKNQLSTLEDLIKESTELNDNLHTYNSKIISNKASISKLNNYKETIANVSRMKAAIELLLKEREDRINDVIKSYRLETLNELIQIVQLELTKREQLISKIDVQKAVITNLELQVKEYTAKAELLKIAVKELSPSEGLIAKGLTGFINHFTKQMNIFIASIWQYPLEILPIQANDDSLDLDYKFIIRVNDTYNAPDVSKGSLGMKEVIDIAFKIISMQYLNLSDYPLYLDEPAHNLDMVHKAAMFKMINDLVASNFSQVFMISHFENSYGSIKNMDLTVLCRNNIVLPKDAIANKVTIIK